MISWLFAGKLGSYVLLINLHGDAALVYYQRIRVWALKDNPRLWQRWYRGYSHRMLAPHHVYIYKPGWNEQWFLHLRAFYLISRSQPKREPPGLYQHWDWGNESLITGHGRANRRTLPRLSHKNNVTVSIDNPSLSLYNLISRFGNRYNRFFIWNFHR